MLITFFICQFLYLIDCMIIPCYLQSITHLHSKNNPPTFEELIKKIEKKYIPLTVVCFAFLFCILFLDIIVLNLYKGICCRMKNICNHTQNCCENLGKSFLDLFSCVMCKESDRIIELKRKENEIDNKINNINGNIKNLLAENIKITIENI